MRPHWIGLTVGSLAAAIAAAPAARGEDVILYGTGNANLAYPDGRIVVIDYTTGTISNTFNGPAGGHVGSGYTGTGFRAATGQLYITVPDDPPDPAQTDRGSFYKVNASNANVDFHGGYGPSFGEAFSGFTFIGDQGYILATLNTSIVECNPNNFAFGAFINIPPDNTVGNDLAAINQTLYVSETPGINNRIVAYRNLNPADYWQVVNSYPTPNNAAVLGLASAGGDLYASELSINQSGPVTTIYRLDRTNGNVLDSHSFQGIALDSLTAVPEPSCAAGLVVLIAGLWSRCVPKVRRTR